MNKICTLQPVTPGGSRSQTEEVPADRENDDDWQVAQQRILLYLRALGIPAYQSFEFGLEAFRRAHEKAKRSTEGQPASHAMQELSVVLVERGFAHPPDSPARPSAKDRKYLSTGVRTMPQLHRVSMVVEKIDRKPWLSFLFRGILSAFKLPHDRGTGSLHRVVMLVCFITVLLIVF
ncbi:MAG: hypothetical protein JXD19_00725 [Deltaproteobacteria bacterium]|nr:hypothetical protein [Deltaproteobacteria bacterium]